MHLIRISGSVRHHTSLRFYQLLHTMGVFPAFAPPTMRAFGDGGPSAVGTMGGACPVRDEDLTRKKEHRQRKSRMDQRTRERMPVLPALSAAVDRLPLPAPGALRKRGTQPAERLP